MSTEHDVRVVQAESEQTRDEPLPDDAKGTRRSNRSVVQSVRLPADDFADIEQIARDADVPVSALIRGWILSGLASERGITLADAINRIANDTERLRRLATRNDVA